jgi:hypothetical protein
MEKPSRAKFGYLISVLAPGTYRQQLYAAGADNPIHALVLVGEYCNIANAKIDFERELGVEDIDRLKLERGQVIPLTSSNLTARSI